MKQILIAMLCCLMLASMTIANDGVKMNTEERVINLPQDQGQWYLTIFGDKSNPKFRLLKHWIETYPGLVNLRSQTHLNIYTTDDVRFKRYAETLPGKTCIRLQNSEGTVTSEFWDEYIPMSAAALYQGIKGDLQDKTSWGCLKRRRCRPKPQPQPQPTPVPEPRPQPPVIDKPPVLEPTPKQSGFPWLLGFLSALIGGSVGAAQGYKEEHIDTTEIL